MSANRSEDLPPVGQIERASQSSLIPTRKRESEGKVMVKPWHVRVLMAYYVVLLIGCIAGVGLIVAYNGVPMQQPLPAPEARNKLAALAFLVSGAIVGSILYQIRMLFRFYIKSTKFDSRWLGKYFSAPVEAAALALVIVSLIESGAIILGGQGFDFSGGKPFGAFGVGAIVGLGIREVIGWLGTVTRTMFPTDYQGSQATHESTELQKR